MPSGIDVTHLQRNYVKIGANILVLPDNTIHQPDDQVNQINLIILNELVYGLIKEESNKNFLYVILASAPGIKNGAYPIPHKEQPTARGRQ